ncbi:MAG: O-antigen ligase family protein [Solirubrobacterales bacterium]
MSELLAGIGVVAAAGASAATILLPRGPLRVAAMLAALALFPVLVLGDQWNTTQIADLRDHTGRVVALLAVAVLAVAILAYLFRRWPRLLPLAIVFALPFRIPLHAGGDTANLLVPLYLVIAGGVTASALRVWGSGYAAGGAAGTTAGTARRAAVVWLPRVLAIAVVLYALQTLYSEDFSKGLQNVCFFLVPFTVAYGLIRDQEWDVPLLRWVLIVVAVGAVVFVGVGTVEYAAKELFWNDQVIRSNEFHTYFRVNSVFWDPNVYGRYLALVIVVATAALLWVRERRELAPLTVLIGVLWLGLAQTFSESSYIALLAGLAMLAAIRWSWRWTVVVAGLAVLLMVGVVAASGTFNLEKIFSGRAALVTGGLELFTERPVWGYGSGSFEQAYGDHRDNKDVPVSASHTEPVTVLAEQGVLGFAVYVALIAVALWAMAAGMWRGPPQGTGIGRAAVLAAFVALLVHTLSYAGFFEDPITWVLLAVGASLASRAQLLPDRGRGDAREARPAVRDPA